MGIAFVRDQADTATTNGTTSTPTMQTGATAPVNGDLLLWIGANNKGTTETYSAVPAGWTNEIAPFTPANTNSSSVQGRMDYRVAASDSGTSYQWKLSGSCEFMASVLEYSGVNATAFDVTPITDITNAASLPGITTVTANCMLVYAALYYNATELWSADQTGWSQRLLKFDGSNLRMYVADKIQAAAGASGTVGPTWSTSPTHISSALFALRPAAAAAVTAHLLTSTGVGS